MTLAANAGMLLGEVDVLPISVLANGAGLFTTVLESSTTLGPNKLSVLGADVAAPSFTLPKDALAFFTEGFFSSHVIPLSADAAGLSHLMLLSAEAGASSHVIPSSAITELAQ